MVCSLVLGGLFLVIVLLIMESQQNQPNELYQNKLTLEPQKGKKKQIIRIKRKEDP